MFTNFVKIALRHLLRRPGFTFINIAGLAVGMACVVLIMLYVRYELSYDRFNSKSRRIYRLMTDIKRDEESRLSPRAAAPTGAAIAAEIPEVLSVVRIADPWTSILVQYQDRQFYEPKVYYADPNIFEVFDFPLQMGNPLTALQSPQSVVLSKTIAEKYFGKDDPLGKTLRLERGAENYVVTGVLETIPTTSTLRPDLIIPFVNLGSQRLTNWLYFSYPTYVLLRENASPAALVHQFPSFVKRHYADAPSDFPAIALSLQPLADVHLYADPEGSVGKLSPKMYMYMFSALALLILLVACVNYTNMATASAQQRAMEVGVRKVLGGLRSHLMFQFLAESFVIAIAAIGAALVIVEFSLPMFNELSQKELLLSVGSDWVLVAGCLALMIGVGVGAGSYPAFVLSRFRPIDALKGTARTGPHGVRLRQFLVISQFAISIFLIACMLIVNNQIDYIHDKQLGFDKEQVLTIQLKTEREQKSWPVLKTELLRHPEVMRVSGTSGTPADPGALITLAERGDNQMQRDVYTYHADHDFFGALGVGLAAGRFFSPDFPGDSTRGFILNETAVRKFGWESPQAAIGQPFIWYGRGGDEPKEGRIVGVVKDFHFRPLYEEIAAAVFHLTPDGKNYLMVRVMPGSMTRALDVVQTLWQSFDPHHALEFTFLDARVNAQYGAETRLLRIFGMFSGLAVFLSCLGLLGLVSFTIEQRTKEVGIRKVLGASAFDIVLMLSHGLSFLMLFAFVIAVPVAWYATDKWLQNFAYHNAIGFTPFVLSGLLLLCIAWITICFQTIRAARANPVDALRYE
jgi:putative ABC transport system permease protein